MTTLTKVQVQRAEKLRAEGKSLREIAAAIGVAAATVKKALDQKQESGTHSTLEQIRKQRLIRLKHQNAKLEGELKKMRAEWVPLEQIKRDVTACDAVVKAQFLALGPMLAPQLATMTEPREIAKLLTDAVTQTCNDLASNGKLWELPEDHCLVCGTKTKEEVAL